MFLFELLSIAKCKTEQSNSYIFNEYLNWLEIKQSNCKIYTWLGNAVLSKKHREHLVGIMIVAFFFLCC